MIEDERLIEVINKIIANPDKISNVVHKGGGDYLFLYDSKHRWYIGTRGPEYELRLYNKSNKDMTELAKLENFEGIEHVEFSTLNKKEASLKAVFKNLYNVIVYKDQEFDDDFTDMLSN